MNGCTPEYNARTKEMMAELEKLKAQHAEVSRNASRQRQVEKQAEQLRQRKESGDTARPAKRQPIGYDEGVKKAVLERDRLRRQVDALVAKGDRLNQSTGKRIADFATNLHMFNIFTSPFVYPKLAAAVGGGHALAVTQAAAISMAKLIPAIRRIADISERHGAGLTVKGLQERFGAGMKAAPDAAKESFLQGHSNLEAAHGDPVHATDAYWGHVGTLKEALDSPEMKDKVLEAARVISSYPGRSHGVIKQFLSTPEFYQSFADRSLQLRKQLSAQGMKPEQVEEFMGRETTQAMLGEKALKDAYESKMQGSNVVSDAVIGAINRMANSDKPMAMLTGYALKNIMPVARVGSNVFKQGTSLIAGGAKAAIMNAMVKARVSKAVEAAGENADIQKIYREHMTPERADYITKNIGQNMAGLGLFAALGMVFNQYLGGVPGAIKVPKSAYTDENSGILKPDEAKIANVPVGAWGFHGAPAAMMQIGAGIVKVFEKEMGKPNSDATDAALTALGSNLWNWTERTIPEFDVARRTDQTLSYARGGDRKGHPYGNPWGEVLGNQIRSQTIPLGLQQYAQSQDKFKGFRSPHNLTDDMKLGLPGYREEVPTR